MFKLGWCLDISDSKEQSAAGFLSLSLMKNNTCSYSAQCSCSDTEEPSPLTPNWILCDTICFFDQDSNCPLLQYLSPSSPRAGSRSRFCIRFIELPPSQLTRISAAALILVIQSNPSAWVPSALTDGRQTHDACDIPVDKLWLLWLTEKLIDFRYLNKIQQDVWCKLDLSLHLELSNSALQDIPAGPQTGSDRDTFGFVWTTW